MLKSTLIALITMLVLLSNFVVADGKIYPLITYKCDTDADIITITNSLLKSEGESYNYSAVNGTYSPWHMVDIDRTAESTKIVKSRKISNICKLSSGEYEVIIEPKIFSKNLKGQCGESISGSITVLSDDIAVLEKTSFENYCHGNTPIITRITIFGKTGDYKIKRTPKYKFY